MNIKDQSHKISSESIIAHNISEAQKYSEALSSAYNKQYNYKGNVSEQCIRANDKVVIQKHLTKFRSK